jgi:hypothetical protein
MANSWINFAGYYIVPIQTIIIYWKYIPDLLIASEQAIDSEQIAFLKDGIHKIIINLGTWIFILMILNLLLIYVVWNVKKFFDEYQ